MHPLSAGTCNCQFINQSLLTSAACCSIDSKDTTQVGRDPWVLVCLPGESASSCSGCYACWRFHDLGPIEKAAGSAVTQKELCFVCVKKPIQSLSCLVGFVMWTFRRIPDFVMIQWNNDAVGHCILLSSCSSLNISTWLQVIPRISTQILLSEWQPEFLKYIKWSAKVTWRQELHWHWLKLNAYFITSLYYRELLINKGGPKMETQTHDTALNHSSLPCEYVDTCLKLEDYKWFCFTGFLPDVSTARVMTQHVYNYSWCSNWSSTWGSYEPSSKTHHQQCSIPPFTFINCLEKKRLFMTKQVFTCFT